MAGFNDASDITLSSKFGLTERDQVVPILLLLGPCGRPWISPLRRHISNEVGGLLYISIAKKYVGLIYALPYAPRWPMPALVGRGVPKGEMILKQGLEPV